MIRRLFWLTVGAALGIAGYRRATALARTAPAMRVRELTRFAGDVREGMEIYRQRQLAAPGRRAIEGPGKPDEAPLPAGRALRPGGRTLQPAEHRPAGPARPTDHGTEEDR